MKKYSSNEAYEDHDNDDSDHTKYCILSKAVYTDSSCTSTVSYTEKVPMLFNECITDGASSSYKITACTSTGWTRTGYSVANCASGANAVAYTSSQCIQLGSTSNHYKAAAITAAESEDESDHSETDHSEMDHPETDHPETYHPEYYPETDHPETERKETEKGANILEVGVALAASALI